jgi:hypothetical protein
MDWRQRLAAYDDAKAEFDQATRLFTEAVGRFEAARPQAAQRLAPLILGVELARRRALRQSQRLREAEYRLTQGRPLDEVLWSLPDEI